MLLRIIAMPSSTLILCFIGRTKDDISMSLWIPGRIRRILFLASLPEYSEIS
jgi:hypothetical protein